MRNRQTDSNAITVIAAAASFELQKPLRASVAAMDWLETRFQDRTALERLRRQPWILSALLKPFFKREAEQAWSTGNVVHLQRMLLSAEKTRPLRRRALSIVDGLPLERYHLWHATRANLLARLGRDQEARAAYLAAAELAPSQAERDFLEARAGG